MAPLFSVTAKELLTSKKDEQLVALQTLADEMSRYDQQDESTAFPEAIAKALGNKKLLKHRDGDVRLVVACCTLGSGGCQEVAGSSLVTGLSVFTVASPVHSSYFVVYCAARQRCTLTDRQNVAV